MLNTRPVFGPTIVLVVVLGAARALALSPNAREFLAEAQIGFQVWDTDHDGELSVHEIELAVANPKVTGKPAATAATLRRAIRADHDLKSVTFKQVVDAVEHKSKMLDAFDMADFYHDSCQRIATTNRALFVSDRPHAEKLSQGRLGDCFLLASLGTIAATEPARLKKMFKTLPGGKFEATLGTGRKLVLDMPTDAEIC
ncbi:MAG TPA: hypothetical protein VG713_17950, partial [Pirellulales bacterium]|nr:hypothetical protein [Pirellulales bacterium]